ncbi:MAG: DNA polymerase III subunit delta [Coxiellaceae bacterium]|nr:DNA polymerase III subunit delta [Coxiellaceae bacterium]
MQITLKQLSTHLDKSLYLISSDESLLAQDTRDTLVAVFKKKGFSEKQLIHMDTGFQSEQLTLAINNQDLFSEKKLIDIRNANAKFDADSIATLEKYCLNKNSDQVIIITTDKLSAAQQKSAWFQCVNKNGYFIPIWPIAIDALPQWIVDRARDQFSLKLPIDVARNLAFFSEGNLLSAEQALTKLQLLYNGTEITREQLITVLSDHARFNVFDLSNALAQRNTKKVIRILERLEKTGEEPVLVLWSICRELRNHQRYTALQYAAKTDEIIKGAQTGDIWLSLKQLSLMGCGHAI